MELIHLQWIASKARISHTLRYRELYFPPANRSPSYEIANRVSGLFAASVHRTPSQRITPAPVGHISRDSIPLKLTGSHMPKWIAPCFSGS
ncbi:hypothetical protein PoB_006018000 [Plakobranchus ocellatus]|uniref:Uncharacterized protein n=1 Tax=Plakobranchus ocellatus TaxID=259542 RepID=A0AAV4CP70_9GAST|nr:hypothetical protein PoB_006018000 [Plakobranchus ocellatus]